MYSFIVKMPCGNVVQRDDAIKFISDAGGKVQNYRFDFDRKEIVVRVVVEPEYERSFKVRIDGGDKGATLTSGSRGGRGAAD